MEIVEQRIEISCELEIVQQFCEFIEDVHIDNSVKNLIVQLELTVIS